MYLLTTIVPPEIRIQDVRNALRKALVAAANAIKASVQLNFQEEEVHPPRPHAAKTLAVQVLMVRLLKARPYCGNHPGPCPLGVGRKRRSKVLEALDWIRFNNTLNQAIDALNIPRVSIYAKRRAEKGRTLWVRRHGVGRRVWAYRGPDRGREWVSGESSEDGLLWEGEYRFHDEPA